MENLPWKNRILYIQLIF